MDKIDIIHPPKQLQLSHTDSDTKDLYQYTFTIDTGKIYLTHIDRFKKNGKTYRKEEYYHWQYKTKITNFETGEFEEPKVPDYLWEIVRLYFVGYVAQCSI